MTNHLLYDSQLDKSGYYWDEIMPGIRAIDGAFFVTGDLGLWNGPRHVWGIFKTAYTAIQAMIQGCDNFDITETSRGKVTVRAYHHDGTNVFEIRKLTPGNWHTENAAMRHSTNARLWAEMRSI